MADYEPLYAIKQRHEGQRRIKHPIWNSLSLKVQKNVYIIAGCNGAGKTTASFTLLPEILDCKEFVNADEIAKGLSPFQPEKVSIEAGKIMVVRINDLINRHDNFAFETTLASRNYASKIKHAQQTGYNVVLLFFWLENVNLAIERVKTRVKEGGHNIENKVIERRYKRGIVNLFDLYIPIIDELMVFDNSEARTELIAVKAKGAEIIVLNSVKFTQLKKHSHANA